MPPVLVSRWVGRARRPARPSRPIRLAQAGRRSGWALDRPRRIRVLREHQAQVAAFGDHRCRAYVLPVVPR